MESERVGKVLRRLPVLNARERAFFIDLKGMKRSVYRARKSAEAQKQESGHFDLKALREALKEIKSFFNGLDETELTYLVPSRHAHWIVAALGGIDYRARPKREFLPGTRLGSVREAIDAAHRLRDAERTFVAPSMPLHAPTGFAVLEAIPVDALVDEVGISGIEGIARHIENICTEYEAQLKNISWSKPLAKRFAEQQIVRAQFLLKRFAPRNGESL